MEKIKVLFVCIHNSARSQMAEAFLNTLGQNQFSAESAGLNPGTLNPLVVEVMREIGIDISANRTKGVQDFIRAGKTYDYIITVCDESSAEQCPTFPGSGIKVHWGFPDPSFFAGDGEEKLQKTRDVRASIQNKIKDWIKTV